MKIFKLVLLSAFSLFSLFASTAHAVVPASVVTAIADATTDSQTIAASVLVLIIGIAAFLWMRKAAR